MSTKSLHAISRCHSTHTSYGPHRIETRKRFSITKTKEEKKKHRRLRTKSDRVSAEHELARARARQWRVVGIVAIHALLAQRIKLEKNICLFTFNNTKIKHIFLCSQVRFDALPERRWRSDAALWRRVCQFRRLCDANSTRSAARCRCSCRALSKSMNKHTHICIHKQRN